MKRFFVILGLLFGLVIFGNYVSADIVLEENSTWSQNLTGVRYSAVAWGDMDNDNDWDIIITGCLPAGAGDCNAGSIAKIYENNGTALVENSTWGGNLTAFGLGSVAWGDIDNDGDLDLALTGCTTFLDEVCNGEKLAKIYENNGTALVENSTWGENLTAVYDSSLAWGDIDNDGDLDLISNGNGGISGKITKVYINNGTVLVENSTWQSDLEGVYQGNVALGDIDNDDDLDLALTGDNGEVSQYKKSNIYINNGTTFIENTTWKGDLKNVDRSALIWGDVDNDGDIDLMLIGQFSGDHLILYNNTGISLTEDSYQSDRLQGLYRGSIAFGDFDNNGYLDLAATGKEVGRAKIYDNNGTLFVNNATAHSNISDNIIIGSLAWNDIDNDGALDLIITGLDSGTGNIANVYINNGTNTNTAPNPPSGTDNFSVSYANGRLTLTWNNGSDSGETPTMGLYYNLRVGTASGGNQIVSGVYGGSGGGSGGGGGAHGYFGNMMQRKSISLKIGSLQPEQTIYWSVQTIDTGLAKSAWSAEQTFTLPKNLVDPTITIYTPADHNWTNVTRFIFNATVYDDNNVSNVTLYGNWTGAWTINETNSSGINNTYYTFEKDLSGYADGDYKWGIKACDNESNCIYSNRTLTIDTTYPTIALSTPAAGASWTSSSTVTFTYNASDRAVTSCSLIIDGSVDRSNSSVTPNIAQTFTKTMSNGAYTWAINCTDSAGHENGSATRSLTVSYSADDNGGNGGNGGNGDGTPPPTDSASKSWDKIETEEEATMTIDSTAIGFTEISFVVSEDTTGPSLTVTSGLPSGVSNITAEHTYQYLNIETTKLNDTVIENAIIEFRVNNTWLESNNINTSTIALNRYTTQWTALNTVILSQDDNYTHYRAFTPGFSAFAITGEVLGAAPPPDNVTACTVGDLQCALDELMECVNGTWSSVAVCEYGCSNETKACIEEPAAPTGQEWVILVIGLAIGGIAAVLYWRFGIKKQS